MKEYIIVYRTYRVRALHGSTKPASLEEEINKLARGGWTVKFSNVAVVQKDPIVHGEEPLIVFYSLLEREHE